jgi:hypothetical protein
MLSDLVVVKGIAPGAHGCEQLGISGVLFQGRENSLAICARTSSPDRLVTDGAGGFVPGVPSDSSPM